MNVTKRHTLRITAIGAVSAACVALAGTAAMAATPAAHTAHTTHAVQKAAATKATITAKPSVTAISAWKKFYVNGKTTGLKPGSKVTLQQKQHGKWVTLPASAPIERNHTYSLWVKLGLKGKNDLRMVNGKTASPVFHVTVR
ncbi:hypothetical protein ACH4TE_03050 [Streptomyces sioyaensis]|uniref:hypothetical protein n=1 Tax=Streptomyces sioyaensis TaxID=67364 RepID=UPI0037A84950